MNSDADIRSVSTSTQSEKTLLKCTSAITSSQPTFLLSLHMDRPRQNPVPYAINLDKSTDCRENEDSGNNMDMSLSFQSTSGKDKIAVSPSCFGVDKKDGSECFSPNQKFNTNEVNVCSSPESGFGSDHQYSPGVNTSSSAEVKTIETQSTTFSKPYGTSNPSSSKEERTEVEFIQIVNVSSLAETISKENLKKRKPSGSVGSKNKRRKLTPIPCTKRLNIRQHNSKKVLHFDKMHCDRLNVEEDFVIPVATSCYSTSPPFHISFGGVPVVTKRRNCVLSEQGKNEFVSGLFSSNSLTVNVKRESSFFSTVLSSSPRQIPPLQCNSKPKLTSKTENEDFPSHVLCKSEETTSSSSTDNVLHSNDLHSNSLLTVKQKCLHVMSDHKVVSVISKASSSKIVKPNKSDRIKRLKEILKQREEDLEKARKDCGFIS